MHISWNHKEQGSEYKGQRATAIPSRSGPSGNYVVSKWSRAGGTTTSNSIMKAASGCSIVGVKRCFHPERDGVSLRPECQFSRSRPSWCWKILNLKFMAHPQRRSIKTPRFEIYNYSFLYFPAAPHVCTLFQNQNGKYKDCWIIPAENVI